MDEVTIEQVDAIRRRQRPKAFASVAVDALWSDVQLLLRFIYQLDRSAGVIRRCNVWVREPYSSVADRCVLSDGHAGEHHYGKETVVVLEAGGVKNLDPEALWNRVTMVEERLAEVKGVQSKQGQQLGNQVSTLARDLSRISQRMEKSLGTTSVASPQITHLMGFYNVSSIENLVTEQAAHIERLQAKMRPYPPGPDDGSSPRSG